MARIDLIRIADDVASRSQGLMFVRQMPEMSGMLFKFDKPEVLRFWMANTYIPLDIAFVNKEGVIVKTESLIPLSLKTVSSGSPCLMAIEVPFGSLEKAGGSVGKRVKVDWETKSLEFHD